MSARPTAVLVAEHRLIERVLDALERAVAEAERTRVLPAEFLADFVAFSRSFVDRCHHGKEEGCLFPCLVRCGVPAEGGLIAVMLDEHEEGRRLIARIEQALSLGGAAPASRDAVLGLCRDYLHLLRGHIDKENGGLFPMGDDVMGEGDAVETRECFERTAPEPGTASYDALAAVADRLCAAR